MRTIARVGMAAILALSGCAAETGGEEQTGGLDEGLVTYPDIPFSSVSPARIKSPVPLSVPENGGIAVTMEPRWIQKYPKHPCRVKTVLLLLNKLPPKPEGLGVKSVATFGGPSHLSWSGLAAGTYAIDLDTNNDFSGCVLTSKITIVITP